MTEYDYPGLEQQRKEHEQFRKDAAELRDSISRGQVTWWIT